MTIGETRFSVKPNQVKVINNNTPFPKGRFRFKIHGNEAEIRKSDAPGSVSYVTVPLEGLGTGGEGGKNRRLFHKLRLDMTPWKNKTVGPMTAGQIGGLMAALQSDATLGYIQTKKTVWKDNKATDDMVEATIIRPQDVIAFLKSNDGAVVEGEVRHRQQGDTTYAELSQFYFEAEPAASGIDDDTDDDE